MSSAAAADAPQPKKLTRISPPARRKVQWDRPVDIRIRIALDQDGRRVTPADVETAAEMAANIAKTYLESRTIPYTVKAVEGEVVYSYEQSRKRFNL